MTKRLFARTSFGNYYYKSLRFVHDDREKRFENGF